jgi:hypothetical protein
MKKINKGKQFYKIKQFRLSEENYEWLKQNKKGTWNHFITKIIKSHVSMSKMSGK